MLRNSVKTQSLTVVGNVNSLGVLSRNRNRRLFLAVLFVPGYQRIAPRRQSFNCIGSVVACHGEVGVVRYGDVGAHPRMYVAFHGDWRIDLFPSEALHLR